MTIFLTSDTHFGHERIIELCGRPFQSVEEMDEVMVARWNRVVGPRDDVWHLGDFAHRSVNMPRLFDRLNGRKKLVVGNHDNDETANAGWMEVSTLTEIRLNKRKIVLCHYPLEEWNGFYRGSLHAHGHQHKKVRTSMFVEGLPRRSDVGVDANSFYPIAVDELIEAYDRAARGIAV